MLDVQCAICPMCVYCGQECGHQSGNARRIFDDIFVKFNENQRASDLHVCCMIRTLCTNVYRMQKIYLEYFKPKCDARRVIIRTVCMEIIQHRLDSTQWNWIGEWFIRIYFEFHHHRHLISCSINRNAKFGIEKCSLWMFIFSLCFDCCFCFYLNRRDRCRGPADTFYLAIMMLRTQKPVGNFHVRGVCR